MYRQASKRIEQETQSPAASVERSSRMAGCRIELTLRRPRHLHRCRFQVLLLALRRQLLQHQQ